VPQTLAAEQKSLLPLLSFLFNGKLSFCIHPSATTMPFGWTLPLPHEVYWPESLLWLVPVCNLPFPGKCGKLSFSYSTDAYDGEPTTLLGRIHVWAHHERLKWTGLVMAFTMSMESVTRQFDTFTSTPHVRELKDLAADVGQSANWYEWKTGRHRRDLDMAYLSAWHQDSKSEHILCHLAAQLRHATMLEARRRLSARCSDLNAVFEAMSTKE